MRDSAEVITLADGELHFWRDFFSADEAVSLFAKLRGETGWEQSHIRIAGRQIVIPRLNAWYGDRSADYSYSGVRLTTLPWTETLLNVKNRVESATHISFNSALVNLYRNEKDSVDWHSDDERELGNGPQVASVSLGETRCFELRRRNDHRQRFKLELPGGSLLLMGGTIQHHWQHRVAKEKHPCGERVNITFRWVHNSRCD